MSYVQYLQQQLRELRIRMQSTAEERVICTAAEAAAVMELRMYYCQRCYVRYVLRAVSSAAAAVVLPFYAVTLWVIVSPYTPRVFINKQNIIVAGNYPAFCGTHPYTSHFPPSTLSHHHPPPASRHNRCTP